MAFDHDKANDLIWSLKAKLEFRRAAMSEDQIKKAERVIAATMKAAGEAGWRGLPTGFKPSDSIINDTGEDVYEFWQNATSAPPVVLPKAGPKSAPAVRKRTPKYSAFDEKDVLKLSSSGGPDDVLETMWRPRPDSGHSPVKFRLTHEPDRKALRVSWIGVDDANSRGNGSGTQALTDLIENVHGLHPDYQIELQPDRPELVPFYRRLGFEDSGQGREVETQTWRDGKHVLDDINPLYRIKPRVVTPVEVPPLNELEKEAEAMGQRARILGREKEEVIERAPNYDTGAIADYFNKYKGKATDTGAILRGDEEAVRDAQNLIRSLGMKPDESLPRLSLQVNDIVTNYVDPLADIEQIARGDVRWNDTTKGYQLETQAGLLKPMRGRGLFMPSADKKGSAFLALTGKFDQEQIIGRINGSDRFEYGARFWNPNAKTEDQVREYFENAGVDSIGLRADNNGTYTPRVRGSVFTDAASGRERLYIEQVGILSETQRGLVTSGLNLPERLTMMDTESMFGADFEEKLFRTAQEASGASVSNREELIHLIQSETNATKKAELIKEVIQGSSQGVITEGYARRVDMTDFLAGRSPAGMVLQGEDAAEIAFKRGETAEETIDSLYKFLEGLRESVEGKLLPDGTRGPAYRLAGYNIIQHDIPMLAQLSNMVAEYYSTQQDDESVARRISMLSWGGQADGYGVLSNEYDQVETFAHSLLFDDKTAAFDLTQLQRSQPIMTSTGGYYLGSLSDAEQAERALGLKSGQRDYDITEKIARERIKRQAEREYHGFGERLSRSHNIAEEIEETFNKNQIQIQQMYKKLEAEVDGVTVSNMDDLVGLYKDKRVTAGAIANAMRAVRETQLTESFFGKLEYQGVAAADRQRIVLQDVLDRRADDIMAILGIDAEEYRMIRTGAHAAKEDVMFMTAATVQRIEHLRETGEVSIGYANISPDVDQYKIGTFVERMNMALDRGEEFFGHKSILNQTTSSPLTEGLSDESIEFIKRAMQRADEPKRPIGQVISDTADFIADTFQGNEKEEFSEATVKVAQAAGKAALGAEQAVRDKATEFLVMQLKLPVNDTVKLISRTAKLQRGIALGALAIAGLVMVTNKVKEKTTNDDAWRMGPVEEQSEVQQEERIKQYNQDLSQMGDLAIESSNRRNYSYNMNNNRHDHLFRR